MRSAAFTCGLSSRSPAAQHALAIDGPSQSSERSQHSMRALGELFHPMHVDTWCVPTVISRAKATATRASLIDPIVAEPLIRCKSPFGVLELRIVKAFWWSCVTLDRAMRLRISAALALLAALLASPVAALACGFDCWPAPPSVVTVEAVEAPPAEGDCHRDVEEQKKAARPRGPRRLHGPELPGAAELL